MTDASKTFKGCKLSHGDCLEIMRTMEGESVEVTVTSPPYNIGVDYGEYDDAKDYVKYKRWLVDVAEQLHRVMKTQGSLFLNVGANGKNPTLVADVIRIFSSYFILQNNIVWVKSISIGEDTVGHFKPINSKRFLNNTYEHILHFTKDGNVEIDRLAVGVPFKDKSNIARRGHGQDKRCAGNVWFIPYKTVQSKKGKFNHPAAFPLELVRRCLKLHGKKGLVFDPFAGSGTTLVAAIKKKWPVHGTELDFNYCKIIVKRVERLRNKMGLTS